MTPENDQRALGIFHSVLECEPDQRTAYLEHACEGNPALRSEVESLIRSHEQSGLKEVLPLDHENEANARAPRNLVGQTIGRYEVISYIGRGGMGEVVLARDKELGRKVAIKLLLEQSAEDKTGISRFRQEARAASELNHPNILTVYDVGAPRARPTSCPNYLKGKRCASYCSEAHSLRARSLTTPYK